MSESFFRRWARRKAENAHGEAGADGADPPRMYGTEAGDALADNAESHAGIRLGLPSMKDVASLAADADFSPFLAKGVDKAVRRAAMKKLFSDPHFNVMDGLDIYIDDYTKPSPLPPGMLENLQHAKSTLEPKPLYETRIEDDREQDVPGQSGDGESVETDASGETGEPVDPDGAHATGSEREEEIETDGAATEHHAGAQDTGADEEQPCAGHLPAQHIPINTTEYPSP